MNQNSWMIDNVNENFTCAGGLLFTALLTTDSRHGLPAHSYITRWNTHTSQRLESWSPSVVHLWKQLNALSALLYAPELYTSRRQLYQGLSKLYQDTHTHTNTNTHNHQHTQTHTPAPGSSAKKANARNPAGKSSIKALLKLFYASIEAGLRLYWSCFREALLRLYKINQALLRHHQQRRCRLLWEP